MNAAASFVGNVGIGTTSPAYALHVIDNDATAVYAYSEDHGGAAVHAVNTEGIGVYAEHTHATLTSPAVWAKNTGDGAGLLADAYDDNGQAVYARAYATSGVNYGVRASTSSASGYAGYFEGGQNYFEGNVGIGTTNPGHPLHIETGTGKSRGLHIFNGYSGSSSKYGIYTNLSSLGTGIRYGIYSYVNANGSDASSSYGGRFYVNSNSTTGATYGIYAGVSSAGTGNRWAGYFDGGGVKVTKDETAPSPRTVYGNSMPIAYGVLPEFGTTLYTDYGIASVTHPSTGEWTITLDNSWAGAPVVLITTYNSSGTNDELATYDASYSGGNTIDVHIVDENGTAKNTVFSIMVYGTPQ